MIALWHFIGILELFCKGSVSSRLAVKQVQLNHADTEPGCSQR